MPFPDIETTIQNSLGPWRPPRLRNTWAQIQDKQSLKARCEKKKAEYLGGGGLGGGGDGGGGIGGIGGEHMGMIRPGSSRRSNYKGDLT